MKLHRRRYLGELKRVESTFFQFIERYDIIEEGLERMNVRQCWWTREKKMLQVWNKEIQDFSTSIKKLRDRRKYAKERDKIEEMFKNDFFVI